MVRNTNNNHSTWRIGLFHTHLGLITFKLFKLMVTSNNWPPTTVLPSALYYISKCFWKVLSHIFWLQSQMSLETPIHLSITFSMVDILVLHSLLYKFCSKTVFNSTSQVCSYTRFKLITECGITLDATLQKINSNALYNSVHSIHQRKNL